MQSSNTPRRLSTPGGEDGLSVTTFAAGTHGSDRGSLRLVVTGFIDFHESRQTGEVLWSISHLTVAFHELATFPERILGFTRNCRLPPICRPVRILNPPSLLTPLFHKKRGILGMQYKTTLWKGSPSNCIHLI